MCWAQVRLCAYVYIYIATGKFHNLRSTISLLYVQALTHCILIVHVPGGGGPGGPGGAGGPGGGGPGGNPIPGLGGAGGGGEGGGGAPGPDIGGMPIGGGAIGGGAGGVAGGPPGDGEERESVRTLSSKCEHLRKIIIVAGFLTERPKLVKCASCCKI